MKKTSLPQLRVRTEHTFRKTFAPTERAAERCSDLRAPAAGCVDPGTWGHARWEAACLAHDIEPLFGAEFIPEQPEDEPRRPRCWALAADPAALYRFCSRGQPRPEDFADAPDMIVFAGQALHDPETFDYVDLNPASALARKHSLALARRTKKPLVVTSDAWYAAPEDSDTFCALTDNRRSTLQHIASEPELRASMQELDNATWREAVRHTHEVAERLSGIRLRRAPMIEFEGDLRADIQAGKTHRLKMKHIRRWTNEYEERLQRELQVIDEKRFAAYFLVVGDMVRWAKQHMLVGPARGSSAGSLVCYLLRITEVDPLVHNLLFERFIDLNRADLPDIDIDFCFYKRDKVFDYLRAKYGASNVARLGNVSTLGPRSVLAECGKRLGISALETFAVRNVLMEYSSGDSRYGAALEDTLSTTAPGKKFKKQHPEARVMTHAEGHASHTSIHAAGVIVSNEPITNFCTVQDGVCQIDKASAERLNLLKIDALGLRTLGVIEDAGCVTADTLYGLALDDEKVFRVFQEQRLAGIFQFEGSAQRRVAKQLPVTEFKHLDHITALARPGPLGGGATGKYIERTTQNTQWSCRHPSMTSYLEDTMGVVLYQEQVMRVVRELGGFTWEETSTIRKAMSGRKGVEFFDQQRKKFIAGAAERGIDEESAADIWQEICSFGAWGMNKAHTVSYAIISYWCAFMKAYHPIEYAAALLRNGKDDEQILEMLRELRDEGVAYKPFDPEKSQEDWAVIDGTLCGGFRNIKGIGPAKASALVKRRNANALTAKDRLVIRNANVQFADLNPAHTLWGELYEEPHKYNIRGAVKQIADLRDRETAVIICNLVRKERRDENETVRLQRRGHKYRGQSLFLDAFVVDDSVTKPVILRIRPKDWEHTGEPMADLAEDGKDWFLVRGLWLQQFSMFCAEKVCCLTRPAMFSAQTGAKVVGRLAEERAARDLSVASGELAVSGDAGCVFEEPTSGACVD